MKSYGKISLVATSLIFPVPFLIGTMLGYTLKYINPDKVDISNGLAYLEPILATSFIVLGVIWLIALVYGICAIKHDTNKELAHTSLALLAIITGLMAGYLIINTMTEQLKTNYNAKQLESLRDCNNCMK